MSNSRVAVTNGVPQGAGAANTLPQTDSSPLNSREDYGETDDEMDIRTNLAAEICAERIRIRRAEECRKK